MKKTVSLMLLALISTAVQSAFAGGTSGMRTEVLKWKIISNQQVEFTRHLRFVPSALKDIGAVEIRGINEENRKLQVETWDQFVATAPEYFEKASASKSLKTTEDFRKVLTRLNEISQIESVRKAFERVSSSINRLTIVGLLQFVDENGKVVRGTEARIGLSEEAIAAVSQDDLAQKLAQGLAIRSSAERVERIHLEQFVVHNTPIGKLECVNHVYEPEDFVSAVETSLTPVAAAIVRGNRIEDRDIETALPLSACDNL